MKRIALAAAGILAAPIFCFGQEESPLSTTWWSDTTTLESGVYQGSGKRINIQNNDVRRRVFPDGTLAPVITLGPGVVIEDVEIATHRATLKMKGAMLREVDFYPNINSWVIAEDSVFENTLLQKAGGGTYVKWSLTNCAIYGIGFHQLEKNQMGLQLDRCSFYLVDFPAMKFGDPLVEAQDEWHQIKNCRFVRCRVPLSLLIATEACVFENCEFFGPYKEFKTKQPIQIETNIVGKAMGLRDSTGQIVIVRKDGDLGGAGCDLPHKYARGKLRLEGFPERNSGEVIKIGGIDRPYPQTPTPPQQLPADEIGFVGGNPDANQLSFILEEAKVNTLLVPPMHWRGFLGGATPLTAKVVQLDDFAKPASVGFTQVSDPKLQAALADVVAFVESLNEGWAFGQRVEISIGDRCPAGTESSMALATALVLDSLLTAEPIDENFCVIGDLNPDGTVRAVDDIADKLRGAFRRKVKIVAIPKASEQEALDYVVVNGFEMYAKMQVVTVENFDQARALAMLNREPEVGDALTRFSLATESINRSSKPAEIKAEPLLLETLQKAAESAPNHLSARILLDWLDGKLPRKLSELGSIAALRSGAWAVLDIGVDPVELRTMTLDDMNSVLGGMGRLRNRIDPDLEPLRAGMAKLSLGARDFLNGKTKVRDEDLEKWWATGERQIQQLLKDYEAAAANPKFINSEVR
ncbi:MAG: hypothetical protein ACI8UO_006803 [Verrucomicrobiales bacterium]|jgi:hypothetical protein